MLQRRSQPWLAMSFRPTIRCHPPIHDCIRPQSTFGGPPSLIPYNRRQLGKPARTSKRGPACSVEDGLEIPWQQRLG